MLYSKIIVYVLIYICTNDVCLLSSIYMSIEFISTACGLIYRSNVEYHVYSWASPHSSTEQWTWTEEGWAKLGKWHCKAKIDRVGGKVFISLNKITWAKIISAVSSRNKSKTKKPTYFVRQHDWTVCFYIKLRKCRTMCIRLIVTVYFLLIHVNSAGSKKNFSLWTAVLLKQRYVWR